MITLLVLDIRGSTIADEGSTTILVDRASSAVPAFNACTVNFTTSKPNIFLSGIGSTCSLTFGSPIATVAVVGGTARKVIRKIFGKGSHVSNAVVKVGDTLVVLENTTRLGVAPCGITGIRVTGINRMLTLFDTEIGRNTFAHKGTTAVTMHCARSITPTLNTGSGLGTIWQPNSLATASGFATVRGLGSPGFTSTVAIGAARGGSN